MTDISRRGFLSLLAGSAALLAVSPAVERLIEAPPPPVALPEEFHVMTTVFPFQSRGPIEPGRIELIELTPQQVFRPERLMMMAGAQEMELLHLAASGEPVVEDGVPCELFDAQAFGVRLVFATIAPGSRIVLAFRNHAKLAASVRGCFMGSILVPGPAPSVADEVPWVEGDDDDDDDFDDDGEEEDTLS